MTSESIDALIDRFHTLPGGNMRFAGERVFLKALSQRLKLRQFKAERGATSDEDEEADEDIDAETRANLEQVVSLLEGAEAQHAAAERKAWAADADRRQRAAQRRALGLRE
jgi:hypothetical protein